MVVGWFSKSEYGVKPWSLHGYLGQRMNPNMVVVWYSKSEHGVQPWWLACSLGQCIESNHGGWVGL
jgi:hypothetical protein